MEQGSGQAGIGLAANCPSYSQAGMTTPTATTACLKPSRSFFAAIREFTTVSASGFARYRLSYSRSGQKRGPPQFLS